MINIIPSILTNDPNEVRKLLEKSEGVVDRVSIDIIDGKYAKNKTIDPVVLVDVPTNLYLDFQLMVMEPVNWVEKCVSAGADRIIGHIEEMGDQVEFVGKVQQVGASVGLGIDLKTPVENIDTSILTDIDVVLVMSVPAGFGGQKFDRSVIKKIKQLEKIKARDDTPYKIHVDGGVSFDNIKDVRLAGAEEASVGKLIFEGNMKDNIKKFRDIAYK